MNFHNPGIIENYFMFTETTNVLSASLEWIFELWYLITSKNCFKVYYNITRLIKTLGGMG